MRRGPRRPRLLSGDEARLWSEVAKLIVPLRGRAAPSAPSIRAAPPVPSAPAAKPIVPPPALPSPPQAPSRAGPLSGARPVLKPIGPASAPPSQVSAHGLVLNPAAAPSLEAKERRALHRGVLSVEARIDLHGMIQAEAHAALNGFLRRAQAAGHVRVLVVTGKGGAQYSDPFGERGVLRRNVPHWLRSPELRPLVLGFEEAARHHGGAGALYVRLRRR